MLLSKAFALYYHAVLRRHEGDTMKLMSKISDEVRGAVAIVAPHLGHRKRRRKVAVGLSFEAKRNVLE